MRNILKVKLVTGGKNHDCLLQKVGILQGMQLVELMLMSLKRRPWRAVVRAGCA